tara:strand:+ start:3296 stop:4732 length:1437 start_codon:yes stop_codon:yes gene_type:complete
MSTETLTFKVQSDIGQTTKDAAGLASEFKIMGVSLNGVKSSLSGVAKTAKASFATIKAGIASTGIGLLVIAFGSLATFLTKTKRGADQLDRAFAGIGATVDVLIDRFSRVGEAMSFFLSGEFRKGADLLKGSFSGIVDEIKNESAAMVELKQRQQDLRDADMEFMVQKAATRKEIEKARLVAEDETKSATERRENLKKALELEQQTTRRELELARERMNIQKEEMALSENSAEDEQELARLKAEIIERETASIKMRRRVVTEVNALDREIAAEEEARAKEEQERKDAELEAEKKRIKEKQDAEDKARKEKEEADKKAAELEEKRAKAVATFREDTFIKAGAAIAAVAGENSAAAKGVAVAETIYNTQQGIMAAMGATSVADKLLPYPVRLLNAIATGVMGAKAVQTILSTNPSKGGSGGGMGGGGAGAAAATPAPQMMSGEFDLTGGIEPEPTKAFVVTDEMTNSQNQLANIRRRSTI